METIKRDDPVTLAQYAIRNKLCDKAKWKWAKRYLNKGGKENKKFVTLAQLQVSKLFKKVKQRFKFQFGLRVPTSIREAQELDTANGNTKWADAIETEVNLLAKEFTCFRILKKGESAPPGYNYIPLLWTFAVKFDGRHRARCVAGGHRTPDLEEDMYSGVVDLETVRLALTVAAKDKDMKVYAADISHAYIQANTTEKVYTRAGPEFRELEGQILIITKALYGLKSSGARFHIKLSQNIRDMGFTPIQADYDFYRRDMGEYYDYLAVIVDDLLIFSHNPQEIVDKFTKIYELKGVGTPEYYSGADIAYSVTHECWTLSAKTYITNVCEKIETLFHEKLKGYGSPMEPGDHPELDDTDLLYGADITRYQMLIGCAQWAVTLGRFDIQYATNTLARYNTMPRAGHMKRAMRLFGYLKSYSRGTLYLDPSDPNLEGIAFVSNDWTEVYPDAQEYLPENMPKPTSIYDPLHLVAYVDASHGYDEVTRRSVTGYIICLGRSIIKWHSKRQNTIETSSYGAELVALRIAIEALIELRYKLRMMGVPIHQTSTVLCDNAAVIVNTQFPSSSLKKKHNSVAYHKAREAVAASVIRMGKISGEANIADMQTKPLGPAGIYEYLLATILRSPSRNSKKTKKKMPERLKQ